MTIFTRVQYVNAELICIALYGYGFILLKEEIKNTRNVKLEIKVADVGLLGCYTMWTCRLIPMFWRTCCLHLQETSALRMEEVCSSEMLISTYKSTQLYNPEVV
jgi:hypothetical protein